MNTGTKRVVVARFLRSKHLESFVQMVSDQLPDERKGFALTVAAIVYFRRATANLLQYADHNHDDLRWDRQLRNVPIHWYNCPVSGEALKSIRNTTVLSYELLITELLEDPSVNVSKPIIANFVNNWFSTSLN